MAINLDGIDYIMDTPTDNALNLLNYINQYMLDNNIKDTAGEVIQYAVNAASPIWLIILGLGYMLTIWQKLVYGAGQSLSIADCSDQQLLNIGQIRSDGPRPGVATSLVATISATGGDCIITTDLFAELDGIKYFPTFTTTIPSGASLSIPLLGNVVGPQYIPANTITNFTPPLSITDHFGGMTTTNAVPGRYQEDISMMRRRFLTTSTPISMLDSCIEELKKLPGIQAANIFFNSHLSDSIIIGGITVPPRSAVMFVQGFSPFIASTCYKFLNIPVVNGTQMQTYTTLSGQNIAVTFTPPTAVLFYVKFTVNAGTVPETYKDEIKGIMLASSGVLDIGKNYTQKYLIDPFDNYTVVDILGLEISMNGTNWGLTTNLNKNEIGVITADSISIVEV